MGLKIWGAGWHPRRGDSRSGNDYADMPAGAKPTDGGGGVSTEFRVVPLFCEVFPVFFGGGGCRFWPFVFAGRFEPFVFFSFCWGAGKGNG